MIKVYCLSVNIILREMVPCRYEMFTNFKYCEMFANCQVYELCVLFIYKC